MRVLLHSRPFAPSVGGMEELALLLATALAGAGHEVVVATDTPPGPGGERLPFEVVRGRSVAELARRARRMDLVHASGFGAVSLAIGVAARRPILFTHHAFQAVCLEGGWHADGGCGYRLPRCVALTRRRGPRFLAAALAKRALLRPALGRCAHVAVSRFLGERIPAPRVAVIHNCADTRAFTPAGPSTGSRVVFVGRFVAEKGVPVLLRALRECAAAGVDLSLDLVGRGPLEAEYRRLVEELALGARVRFRGVLRGRALADALAEGIAVVVPSVWDEPFGIVAAEAICCGRLPVVSGMGALPELVEGLGTTFTAGDPTALAAVLQRTAQDHAWRGELERRLPAIASRFTPERLASEYLEAYRRACAGVERR